MRNGAFTIPVIPRKVPTLLYSTLLYSTLLYSTGTNHLRTFLCRVLPDILIMNEK
jgi:hypothetical protein